MVKKSAEEAQKDRQTIPPPTTEVRIIWRTYNIDAVIKDTENTLQPMLRKYIADESQLTRVAYAAKVHPDDLVDWWTGFSVPKTIAEVKRLQTILGISDDALMLAYNETVGGAKRAYLIERLKDLAKVIGTRPQISDLGGNYPNYSSYVDVFGGFSQALIAAGMETTYSVPYELNLDTAIQYMKTVASRLPVGTSFTTTEYKKYQTGSEPSFSTLLATFKNNGFADSWETAVKRLGFNYNSQSWLVPSMILKIIQEVSNNSKNDNWRTSGSSFDRIAKKLKLPVSGTIMNTLRRSGLSLNNWQDYIPYIESGNIPKDSPLDYMVDQPEAIQYLQRAATDLNLDLNMMKPSDFEKWRLKNNVNEIPSWTILANLINTGQVYGTNDWSAACAYVAAQK